MLPCHRPPLSRPEARSPGADSAAPRPLVGHTFMSARVRHVSARPRRSPRRRQLGAGAAAGRRLLRGPPPSAPVWMHAVTRRCGCPADSSDLAAGAAGAATSTPHFSGAGRIAACGSRPARSRPATRFAHVWRASATNTDSVTYRRSAARLPRDTEPRGQAAHSLVRACLRPATLSPLVRPWGRVSTVSAQA